MLPGARDARPRESTPWFSALRDLDQRLRHISDSSTTNPGTSGGGANVYRRKENGGRGGNRTRVHINKINHLRPKQVPQRCLTGFRPTGKTLPCPRRKSGLLGLTRMVLQEFFKGVERLLREPFEGIVPSDDLKSVFVFS